MKKTQFIDDRYRNHDPHNCEPQFLVKQHNIRKDAKNAPHELFHENGVLKQLLKEDIREGM